MSEVKYRPDIDGLRAIAIVLVLVYHSDIGLSGGYIGVDVFFVISGYLITGIIIRQHEAGKFSLTDFWVRRIRRIIPAATVMVLFCLFAGFYFLLPNDYEKLGESVVAQQLMMSNIYFMRNTGYFDGPSHLMLLLHTWSLSVEEQFYICFPFLLTYSLRFGRRRALLFCVMLAILSLVTSELLIHIYSNGAFYSLPSRAWELMLGAIVCLSPLPNRVSSPLITLISWLSLISIFTCACLYDHETPFPGVLALVPCISAALLIYVNSVHLSAPAKLLARRPFVFVGLISYSLYLWHWPIFALYRYWFEFRISLEIAIVLLVVSIFVATLSWKFVEQPFRKTSKKPSARVAFFGAFIATILTIGIGLIVLQNKGLPGRLAPDVVKFASFANSMKFIENVSYERAIQGQFPVFGSPKAIRSCLVWGDSHAMALIPGLDMACVTEQISGFQATRSAMPPLHEFTYQTRRGQTENTQSFSTAVLRFVQMERVNIVFLNCVWSRYASEPLFESRLRETIKQLKSVGTEVVVCLDVPRQDVNVPRYFALQAILAKEVPACGVSHKDHKAANKKAEEVIRRVCGQSDAIVFDPVSPFVNASGLCIANSGQILLYRDSSHLSIEGSLLLQDSFKNVFRQID